MDNEKRMNFIRNSTRHYTLLQNALIPEKYFILKNKQIFPNVRQMLSAIRRNLEIKKKSFLNSLNFFFKFTFIKMQNESFYKIFFSFFIAKII